jgi:hypothetical protein
MPQLPILDISPCSVTWDYEGTELRLDPYLGTVSLKHDDSVAKVYEEAFGDAYVDAVLSGGVVTLDIPMTRSTLEQLEKVLPGATLNVGGDVLTIKNKCGSDMYVDAKAIAIKPIKDNVVSTTKSQWTIIYKCYPYKAFDLSWDRDKQRVFLVKFMVFPVMESPHVGELYQIGETTE